MNAECCAVSNLAPAIRGGRGPLRCICLPQGQLCVFMLKSLLNLLLPASCLVCQRRLTQPGLCLRCQPELPADHGALSCLKCQTTTFDLDASGHCGPCRAYPIVFGRMAYLWDYAGNVRDMIATMKYQPSFRLCRLAGSFLAARFSARAEASYYDLLVPLPSSPANFFRRSFNQCVPLAEAVQPHCGERCRMALGALVHLGSKHSQASLDHEQRLGNVRKCFSASRRLVEGQNILLIDDVITTGATCTAAALALYKAGAANVDLLALARAGAWHTYRHKIHQRLRLS
jgi:ComF family protein